MHGEPGSARALQPALFGTSRCSVFAVGMRLLLAHAFGPGDLFTRVDVGSDSTVLKAAWGSAKVLSQEDTTS